METEESLDDLLKQGRKLASDAQIAFEDSEFDTSYEKWNRSQEKCQKALIRARSEERERVQRIKDRINSTRSKKLEASRKAASQAIDTSKGRQKERQLSNVLGQLNEIIDEFEHSLMQEYSLGDKAAIRERRSKIVDARKTKLDLQIERARNLTLQASKQQENGEYNLAAETYYEAIEEYNSALQNAEGSPT